jgi:hypothetical protein
MGTINQPRSSAAEAFTERMSGTIVDRSVDDLGERDEREARARRWETGGAKPPV